MYFGTCERACTFSSAGVCDTGDVSGDDGGVSVAIFGADLAVSSFAAPKKEVLEPRLAPPSNLASVTMSSDDAHDTKERPRVGLWPPTLLGASRSPSREAKEEAEEEEDTETESRERSEPQRSS